jgi:hypothetical protein
MWTRQQGVSGKASEFFNTCVGEIPLTSDSGGSLIEFLDDDGLVMIAISLHEDTTHEQLRDIIPIALAWRDKLTEWQGPWPHFHRTRFLEALHHEHRNDTSYAQLAGRVNYAIAECLRDFLELLIELETNPKQISTSSFLSWKRNSIDRAQELLGYLGFKDDEITAILKDGVKRLKKGEEPFEIGYPIDKEKMIRVLRTWREGKKHQLINKGLDD